MHIMRTLAGEFGLHGRDGAVLLLAFCWTVTSKALSAFER